MHRIEKDCIQHCVPDLLTGKVLIPKHTGHKYIGTVYRKTLFLHWVDTGIYWNLKRGWAAVGFEEGWGLGLAEVIFYVELTLSLLFLIWNVFQRHSQWEPRSTRLLGVRTLCSRNIWEKLGGVLRFCEWGESSVHALRDWLELSLASRVILKLLPRRRT